MVFNDEPTQYKKTILSDLQGAWQNLRDEVVNQWPFPECQRIMFHIDEGMSWESVRNLEHMRTTVVLLQSIVAESDIPKRISEWLANAWDSLNETIETFNIQFGEWEKIPRLLGGDLSLTVEKGGQHNAA